MFPHSDLLLCRFVLPLCWHGKSAGLSSWLLLPKLSNARAFTLSARRCFCCLNHRVQAQQERIAAVPTCSRRRAALARIVRTRNFLLLSRALRAPSVLMTR